MKNYVEKVRRELCSFRAIIMNINQIKCGSTKCVCVCVCTGYGKKFSFIFFVETLKQTFNWMVRNVCDHWSGVLSYYPIIIIIYRGCLVTVNVELRWKSNDVNACGGRYNLFYHFFLFFLWSFQFNSIIVQIKSN